MAEGWVTVHREIKDHWVYKDAEYFKAWITILMEVNHSEQKVLIGRTLFGCDRGESLHSLENWGKIFGNWSKSKTKRFFDLLKKESMIELKNERLTTRLSVCNYCKYQDVRNANETQVKRKRNASETQVKRERATNNNVLTKINNENNENNEIETCFSFDEFWNSYGKKVDSKKCRDKYEKISEENREVIKLTVSEYVNSNQDVKFRKNPFTYLNGECWNDQITYDRRTNKSTQKMSNENMNYYQENLGF